MRPDVSYCEPWQGQNQPPHSPPPKLGVQPRWVQTPIRISHSDLPGLTREASVAGSRRLAWSSAIASWISFGVRWRTNSGCLRYSTVTCWPSGTLTTSYSIEESARVSDDGFIWSTKGQAIAAA